MKSFIIYLNNGDVIKSEGKTALNAAMSIPNIKGGDILKVVEGDKS